MAAVDPQGGEKYCYTGLPFGGVQKSSSPPDEGTRKFWYAGLPSGYIYPVSGGGGGTFNRVAFFALMR